MKFISIMNIRMVRKERGVSTRNWIDLDQDVIIGESCESGIEPSRSMTHRVCLLGCFTSNNSPIRKNASPIEKKAIFFSCYSVSYFSSPFSPSLMIRYLNFLLVGVFRLLAVFTSLLWSR